MAGGEATVDAVRKVSSSFLKKRTKKLLLFIALHEQSSLRAALAAWQSSLPRRPGHLGNRSKRNTPNTPPPPDPNQFFSTARLPAYIAPTNDVHLTPEQEHSLTNAVATGRYRDQTAIIQTCVSLLQRAEAERAALIESLKTMPATPIAGAV
jgi:Arc/MetJ-type ribon-helix-helix transcriptional regulator